MPDMVMFPRAAEIEIFLARRAVLPAAIKWPDLEPGPTTWVSPSEAAKDWK